ncbi:MAG: hypothetical protein B6U76_06300 [Desulfurococcales archaeon ex4484_217_2]|nr:MAG: hypothetical protein B6U76_06300 [Desulfurococcales archaeon ex4484_217_2]
MSHYLLRHKLKVRGKSGIVHIIDVVYLNGEKFIYMDLVNENYVGVITKFIVGLDVGFKAYVRASKALSNLAVEIVEKLGGILDIV